MNIRIFISMQALNRLAKDKYIQKNKKAYNQEILMIAQSLSKRPSEMIGKFHVSPRGRKDFRIAWHFEYDEKTDIVSIYIDDLLYHERGLKYVDDWTEKVRIGEINLSSYSRYSVWEVL